jgi:EpsI family protein
MMATTVLAAIVIAVAPAVASRLKSESHAQPVIDAPLGKGGASAASDVSIDWSPHYLNPTTRLKQTYEFRGEQVSLFIGYYRNQRQSSELIASQNVMVHSADKVWVRVEETKRTTRVRSQPLHFSETIVRGPSYRLLTWSWYWVDDRYVVNPYWVKFLQARSQLFGRGDDSAVVALAIRMDDDSRRATMLLQEFVEAMLPSITESLRNAQASSVLRAKRGDL